MRHIRRRLFGNALSIGLGLGLGLGLSSGFQYPLVITNPNQVAGLTRAWSPVDSTITTDGNGIATVAAAYGTTGDLTGGATTQHPDLASSIGPANQNMFQFTASRSEYFSFTSLDIQTTNSEFWFVIGQPSVYTATKGLIGRGAATSTIQIASNGGGETTPSVLVRVVGGASTTVALPASLNRGCNILNLSYNQATGFVTPYLNGVAGTAVSVGTAGFLLDTLGRNNATNYSDMYLGDALIYNRLHSVLERAALNRLLATWISSVYYQSSAGANTNVGWSQSAPWLDRTRLTTHGFYSGDTFAPKKGEIERLTSFNINVPSNLIFDGGLWGSGDYHNYWGSTVCTGAVSLGGGVYSVALAKRPYIGGSGDAGVAATGYTYDRNKSEPDALSTYAPTPSNTYNYVAFHKASAIAIAANVLGQRMPEDIVNHATPTADKFGYLTATGTGTIVGTLLTISGSPTGTWAVGSWVVGASAGTYITALGTGTGGAGTYTVNNSQTLGSTAVTGSTLFIHCYDGGDPNSRVEIPYRADAANSASLEAGSMFGLSSVGATLRRVHLRYGSMTGVDQSVTAIKDRVQAFYFDSDTIDGTGSSILKYEIGCMACFAGNGARGGSDGNAFSNHGGLMYRRYCFGGAFDYGGLVDTVDAGSDNQYCFLISVVSPLKGAPNFSATHSLQTYKNNIFVLLDGTTNQIVARSLSDTMVIDSCVLFGSGSATGKTGISAENGGGGGGAADVTLKNSIIDGVAIGAATSGSSTIAHTFNDNNGTSAGWTGSTGDIRLPPLFTDPSTFDFTLQAGSPCRAAGDSTSQPGYYGTTSNDMGAG